MHKDSRTPKRKEADQEMEVRLTRIALLVELGKICNTTNKNIIHGNRKRVETSKKSHRVRCVRERKRERERERDRKARKTSRKSLDHAGSSASEVFEEILGFTISGRTPAQIHCALCYERNEYGLEASRKTG